MDKAEKLEEVKKEIINCDLCKIGTTGNGVAGEGNPDAKIVFIGEAPGKQEAVTGLPFIGRSGKLLREAIRNIGLTENDVYITSPVKYLPITGTPSLSQIDHGVTHLEKQLAIIKPRILVLMGATAYQSIVKQKPFLYKMHGEIILSKERKYFITFHPAAALRFPNIRTLFFQDFEKLQYIIAHDN